eukprot:TRINITY_DN1421_c0_g1_i1.p1 TRINITY_DN1421_c0_g1~~TRINITY_DN1421_c0_g1_i1.p1  ORF type:complete len:73 (+),score=6.80 TRINITY_DN1421_c0_g1_i1:194-412(+)
MVCSDDVFVLSTRPEDEMAENIDWLGTKKTSGVASISRAITSGKSLNCFLRDAPIWNTWIFLRRTVFPLLHE